MCTTSLRLSTALLMVVGLTSILFAGCVRSSSKDGASKVASSANVGGSADYAERLSGVWLSYRGLVVGGEDEVFSWGTSRVSSATLVIDLLNKTPFVLSPGNAQAGVQSIEPSPGNTNTVTLHLDEAVELTIEIRADGSIVFPDKTQVSALAVAFGHPYFKVDGPKKPKS